jgi:hypothetical protein
MASLMEIDSLMVRAPTNRRAMASEIEIDSVIVRAPTNTRELTESDGVVMDSGIDLV